MIKKFALLGLMLSILSQTFATGKHRYYIQFNDKANQSVLLATPLKILSQRALDRRAKQGIKLEETDLPVNPDYIKQIAAIKNVKILNRLKWFNGLVIDSIDSLTVVQIAKLSFVQGTRLIGREKRNVLNTKTESNVKSVAYLYKAPSLLEAQNSKRIKGREYDYGQAYNQIAMMNGDLVHKAGYDGRGMVIAVIDAGFYNADNMLAFDSLRAKKQILGTWDFVYNNASVYEDDAHGSMVLSTMAANLPGQMVGTAPQANYWLLRSENAPSEDIVEEYHWCAAAEFADSVGADVINSSLGYTQFFNSAQDHTYADMDGNTTPSTRAANMAFNKGILVVVAAGNEGANAWQHISAPSDGVGVLAVGAVNPIKKYASFSSKGPSSAGAVKPNVADQGQDAIVAYVNGNVGGGNGTSFASPIMAGMCTSFWQMFPNFSAAQIKELVEKSSSQYKNPDSLLGYGIPDFHLAVFQASLGVVDLKRHQAYEANIYPNPISATTLYSAKLFVQGKQNEQLILEFYTLTGQSLSSSEFLVEKGENYLDLNLSNALQSGVYLFVLKNTNGEALAHGKLVKQ